MKRRERKNHRNEKWEISFLPITRYSIIFCIAVVIIILLGGTVLSISQMKSKADLSLKGSYALISQRVNGSIELLESMADLPEFYDPDVPPIEKVKKLDQMSPHFGYLMICYVDSDILVYSDGSEPASLASRDYMQRLFSTGRRQVTDSFAAGADGSTLNYTVAVPLADKDGSITGCLFCAIYFDEVEDILKDADKNSGSDATLVGSQGQIMSSSAGLPYGIPVMDIIQDYTLFGITSDKLQEQLLAEQPGDYWSIQDGGLCYTSYQRVENTGWDILSTIQFGTVFADILPGMLLTAALAILASLSLLLFVRRYIACQMQVVDTLVDSVEELEKKIYQDERPDDVDFSEILRLTSNGLSDSLTGVVTRSVFINRAKEQIKKADPQKVASLFFVDMDNLKYINDTCGHRGGDIALQSIAYILREYEKKYDGVAGRYGGDEFVLLLTSLDSRLELNGILDELVLRFQSDIRSGGQHISIKCSIGVAVYQQGMTLEEMIADADEALYYVKKNGKGYYHIH